MLLSTDSNHRSEKLVIKLPSLPHTKPVQRPIVEGATLKRPNRRKAITQKLTPSKLTPSAQSRQKFTVGRELPRMNKVASQIQFHKLPPQQPQMLTVSQEKLRANRVKHRQSQPNLPSLNHKFNLNQAGDLTRTPKGSVGSKILSPRDYQPQPVSAIDHSLSLNTPKSFDKQKSEVQRGSTIPKSFEISAIEAFSQSNTGAHDGTLIRFLGR